MKCEEVRGLMPDLASGLMETPPEIGAHVAACPACAEKLQEFRQTMALLDEWQAPEPSPYFDVRLMARVREERAKPSGWLYWLRKPALAVSLAVLMVASVTLIRWDTGWNGVATESGMVWAPPGTAVGDLQALDKNSELYSDFELLDDMTVQQDVNANP